MTETVRMPTVAALLGYGGLIPFAAAAIAVVLDLQTTSAVAVFSAYSATILAFLGGIQWGLAFHLGPDRLHERLIVGVIPSLLAWVALLLGATAGLIVLTAGFLAVYAYDRVRNLPALPAWFGRLRLHLTAGVAICHLAVLVANGG
jgi:hypothetical protein